MHPPTTLRALKQDGVFQLEWPELAVRLPFKYVRCQCPCAGCIDEHTGQRILDPATVPDSIQPTGMSFVGSYAVKIVWTDSHATGLYTWEHLRQIAEQFRAE